MSSNPARRQHTSTQVVFPMPGGPEIRAARLLSLDFLFSDAEATSIRLEESEKVLLEWFESQCRSQLYRFRMEDWLPMISSSVRGAYFVVRRDSSTGRALGVRLGRAAGFAA